MKARIGGGLVMLVASACAGAPPASLEPVAFAEPPAEVKPSYVAQLQRRAQALRPIITSPLAQRFLDTTRALPPLTPSPRHIYKDKLHAWTEARLNDDEKRVLTAIDVDEERYYEADVSDPLHYARLLDVLAQRGVAPPPSAKLLDFGYGSIGHLRMLAELGLDATGVDVRPELLAYYAEPGDTGAIGPGRVRVLNGHYPAEPRLVHDVGDGYDLVLAKNTLKKGYIHPDRRAPDRWLIHLGVDDAVFLRAFHDALRPGGRMLVYNIYVPIPLDQPFKPMSDGRSPFTRAQWEAAGLVVDALDEDDTDAIRRVLVATGDAESGKTDFHALYTLVHRPGPRQGK